MNINKCDSCLENLLQIKDLCECTECDQQYYLNDFVQIPNKYFSDLATEDYGSGYALASQLIRNAQITVYSDIVRAMPTNLDVNKSVFTHCMSCSFTNVYTVNGGSLITINRKSSMNRVKVPKISVKTNNDGDYNIQIIDKATGDILNTYPITLVSGTIINFTTAESFDSDAIIIKFAEPNVETANITCTYSSCGCGGKAKAPTWFTARGWLNGSANSQQSGFIPCVELTCNEEYLVCSVISSVKSIVARAMAYDVAINIYNMMKLSTVWKETQLNISMEAVDENIQLLQTKYNELIFGSVVAYGRGATVGIVQILGDSAKNIAREDQCILCTSNNYTATGIM